MSELLSDGRLKLKPLRREGLLPEAELPDAQSVVSEGRRLGALISPVRSAFHCHYDVASESEYKRRCIEQGRTMFHAQIGFRDVEKTKRACAEIYEKLDRRGLRVDRYGITFDRNMGYLAASRKGRPKGTGIVLDSLDEWHALTASAPVAAHFGDFMIGLPAAVENTTAALQAGAATIGNLAHFYNYRLLYEDDELERAVATVQAIAMVAAQPHVVTVSSNVDDGFGSLFVDIACTLGLVLVEKHLVENLIGAAHVTVFGNTFGNPYNRLVFQRALSKITDNMGPMVYGATTLYGPDESANQAALSHYLGFDIAAQALSPSGHAVTAIPITEYERIPDIDEIIEAQAIANRLSEFTENVLPLIDGDGLNEAADKLIVGGETFKKNLFQTLEEAGVDTNNPVEILLCIRRLGARELEQRFGPGTFDASLINSRQPLLVSENMKALQEVGKRALQALSRQQQIVIQKRKLTAAIATSDVHEYGKIVLEQTLRDLDVEVCDAGTSTDPSTVVQVACDTDADFIALSTYNGIALTYLQALRDEMRRSGLDIPVFVGGRMNQIPEGSNTSLPVDVTSKVSALGMTVCSDVGEMLNQLSRDS